MSIIVLLATPFVATAQSDDKQSAEVGARVAASVDKKIIKGLHISLEEELRFDNNFKSFDRFHTTLAMKYKVHENVKLGLGFAMINSYSSSNAAFKNTRLRVFADVTGTLKLGNWNLSLKERFQATFRTGDYNVYQNPACALTLKSRLMLKYKGFQRVEPYAYFELRNYMNAPVISAAYDGTAYYTLDGEDSGESGWFLTGFNGGYVNRYRGAIGVEVRLDKRNSLDFYFMGDYYTDKVVDANQEGTKLKSYTREYGFKGTLGVSYQFSF
ncbi:MAG: DUF2490 domain-containing protein [Bacteroidales bacterium]|nr:DUF2490 domain-containing protein [Bacteroidales bacterium]